MNLQNIPFYINWATFTSFINTNFSTLILDDNTLFLGFIIVNIAYVFMLYLLIKLVKFVVVLCKNIIYR